MKRWVVLIAVALGIFLFVWLGFYYTGGRGLFRVSKYYLVRDLPDKKYVWSDFLLNNTSKQITGFYSATFSNDKSVAIWTLTGLQRFYHQDKKSVYYYRDACAVIKSVIENKTPTEPVTNPYTTYLDIAKWRGEMRQEYMLTVKWDEEGGKRVVDKLWSMSGKYKMPGLIGEGVCE